MTRYFDFIEHGHGEVLVRNPALPVGAGQELISAQPEFSGTLAGNKESRRAEHSPVGSKTPRNVFRGTPFPRQPLRARILAIAASREQLAGYDFEVARSANDQLAFDA